MLTVEAVAKAIGVPADEWPGNCHSIACDMCAAGLVPGGKPRYGHYHGPIAPGTMFYKREIVRHGWIEAPDGQIVDPTRWVFEGAEPYVFQGWDEDGYYDTGGNQIRYMLMSGRPMPKYDPEARQFDVPNTEAGVIMKLVLGGHEGDKVSFNQLIYLANLPPNFEEEDIVRDIYRWLQGEGLQALIPMDNRDLILG